MYYVSVCICGLNTNHASTYQKGIIGMYLCVFLFSYTILFYPSSFSSKPFVTWHLIRQTDLNRTKTTCTRNLPKWLDDKDEAKRFGNEWKIVATKNTHTKKLYLVKAKRKRKWAHRIIYESVENYATIAFAFDNIDKHKTGFYYVFTSLENFSHISHTPTTYVYIWSPWQKKKVIMNWL